MRSCLLLWLIVFVVLGPVDCHQLPRLVEFVDVNAVVVEVFVAPHLRHLSGTIPESYSLMIEDAPDIITLVRFWLSPLAHVLFVFSSAGPTASSIPGDRVPADPAVTG